MTHVVAQLHILLVEDNPGDVQLFMHALKRAGSTHAVSAVSDGVEALDFLRATGQFADATRPDLIVMDLNLPRRSGRELLGAIKSDPALSDIPAIVLSSSDAEQDIRESYASRANCYLRKPSGLDEFLATIRAFEHFWCQAARLPHT
jgi:CheY-like chemotaxis protein